MPDSSLGSGGATLEGGTANGGKLGTTTPAAGGEVNVTDAGAPALAGAGPLEVDQDGLLPVAPKHGEFMWQSQQTRLRTADDTLCTAKITLAVGPSAVCFVNSDDLLVCSGTIDTHTYGPGFQPVGLSGVDQILLAPSSEGGAICVHTRTGAVQCMGSYNDWGQFGGGVKGTAAGFVTWARPNLVAFASGTWDQMCALDTQGLVACSGSEYGLSPVVQPGTGHRSVWVDTAGYVQMDDPEVLRAGEGRTECQVTAAQGLLCQNTAYGKPGHVVAGGMGQPWTDQEHEERPCWLDDEGHVSCNAYPEAPFGERMALALGTNYYTKELCAVLQDGSVDCAQGNAEHRLAPAGSALIDCK